VRERRRGRTPSGFNPGGPWARFSGWAESFPLGLFPFSISFSFFFYFFHTICKNASNQLKPLSEVSKILSIVLKQ
jgi:hypothetical protein